MTLYSYVPVACVVRTSNDGLNDTSSDGFKRHKQRRFQTTQVATVSNEQKKLFTRARASMAPRSTHKRPLSFFFVLLRMYRVTNTNRYFSIAVQDNATDLLISLDAQSGDPDM